MILFMFATGFYSKAQQIEWDKTYGSSGLDNFQSIAQTSDGGYILGGTSGTSVGGDKSATPVGGSDYWIVKINAAGEKKWDKVFGGLFADNLAIVLQTEDGGYILGGESASDISGDKSEASKGYFDFWIIRLDAAGNKLWDKTIGGDQGESLTTLIQTKDGGYLLGGTSPSGISGDKSEASRGGLDYWIVKLNTAGEKQWDHTFGGDDQEHLRDIIQTNDGGFMLAGDSRSGISGNKTNALKGETDYWIVKLSESGNIEWDKAYGGNDTDFLYSVVEVEGGNYILGGFSWSGISGDKSVASKGADDYWVIKINSTGEKLWDKVYGGDNSDRLTETIKTRDGGFLLGGISASGVSGDKTGNSRGSFDYWVVKISAEGRVLWDKTIGGDSWDQFENMIQTADGGYMVGGNSPSSISGEKSEASRGANDYWIVKLAPENMPPPSVCNTIDFESSSTGFVTSVNTGAGVVYITNKMRQLDGTYAPQNHAAIFNTASPTGDDLDLWTADWGHVLIINKDLNPEPDDNAWGGEMTLDFSEIGPVTMTSLKALDFDVYEGNSWVYLYDGAGKEVHKVRIENLGNMSQQVVNLGNTKGVMKMKVVLDGLNSAGMLAGSGAIDDIKFCVEESVNPQPDEKSSAISQATVFPNPIESKGAVAFKLNTTGNYVVELYDLKGNLIRELKTGYANAGENISVELDGNGLKAGLYIARIISANDSRTIKVILKK
ncbi:T9SS type A sorting domain-containing protein [Pontibacter populi]|uniref:T9SS type A sorting domain-containing protein n=1 Tax=Pontibacter populi TaxID=890055 RepID=A0ABV1RR07_9BACT